MASVNRYLKDKAMDHIDHALGRPADPLAESYRNYFATGENDPKFVGNPHWQAGSRYPGGRYFHVTDEGRKALKAHLAAIGDKHRNYVVTIKGYGEMAPRAAKSHGAARYDAYIDFSDYHHDTTFGEFQKISNVRLA
jgi:hypothetical protein